MAYPFPPTSYVVEPIMSHQYVKVPEANSSFQVSGASFKPMTSNWMEKSNVNMYSQFASHTSHSQHPTLTWLQSIAEQPHCQPAPPQSFYKPLPQQPLSGHPLNRSMFLSQPEHSPPQIPQYLPPSQQQGMAYGRTHCVRTHFDVSQRSCVFQPSSRGLVPHIPVSATSNTTAGLETSVMFAIPMLDNSPLNSSRKNSFYQPVEETRPKSTTNATPRTAAPRSPVEPKANSFTLRSRPMCERGSSSARSRTTVPPPGVEAQRIRFSSPPLQAASPSSHQQYQQPAQTSTTPRSLENPIPSTSSTKSSVNSARDRPSAQRNEISGAAVALDCQHSICQVCIKSLISGNKITCPSCGKITILAADQEPRRNYALDTLADVPVENLLRLKTSAVLEQMGAFCPVCFDSYASCVPCILNCGHSMCETCITDIATHHKSTTVECPECRKATDLRDKVNNVALQTAVQTILALKHKENEPSKPAKTPPPKTTSPISPSTKKEVKKEENATPAAPVDFFANIPYLSAL